MQLYLGTVTEIFDDKKFIVKFSINTIIEDAVAYPIDTFDAPDIGDPILVYQLESIFGYSFMYKKLRLMDYTRMKFQQSVISLDKDGIVIQTDEDSKRFIEITSDGDMTITSNDGMEITVTKDMDIEVKGNVNLKVEGQVKVDAQSIETTTTSGKVIPDPLGKGGFCAIPICPVTGQPHVGNKLV